METGLKVECFVCPASALLQMPQYLKIYAPGAGIGKHKNIFISIEKKVLLPSLLKKESLQTWSQCTRKAWKQKDCERELHFLKHLIISNQNVVLEAWLTVFKLLRQSCKRGPYSHTGEALPALLPPQCSGRGRGGELRGEGKSKQLRTGTVLPSAPKVFATLPSSLK